MWYRFHLKSFDPRYRPVLIALTRAHHCWDQRYSEELLEEIDPCLFGIDCEDDKEARWLKNHIVKAKLFLWLHYHPHINEHSGWTAQSWPRLDWRHRCCEIEVRRVRLGLCPYCLKPTH